jgi:hypothetical protein
VDDGDVLLGVVWMVSIFHSELTCAGPLIVMITYVVVLALVAHVKVDERANGAELNEENTLVISHLGEVEKESEGLC